jgi:c-di-GMP-related signal transduction protein
MSTQAQSAAAEKPSPCIARQPILAGDESVIGYELLLRDNPDERRATADADTGTRAAINALNLIDGILCTASATGSCD